MSHPRSKASDNGEAKNADLSCREQILRLTERLERCRRSTQTGAHALKSPLISMHGYIGILNQEYRDFLDAEGRDLLSRLEYLVDVALNVVSAVHEYSILDDVTARWRHVSVGELIPAVVETHRPKIEKVGVKILLPEEYPVVTGDPELLVLVFSHLLSNAIDAVHGRRRPRIEIQWRREDGQIRFEVIDNGIGIARRDQKAIFEPYQRLKPAPSAGLGLTIARRIIETHGGSIGVLSRKGRGATFWFTLPSPSAAG